MDSAEEADCNGLTALLKGILALFLIALDDGSRNHSVDCPNSTFGLRKIHITCLTDSQAVLVLTWICANSVLAAALAASF